MGRKALFRLPLKLSCGPLWDFSDSLEEEFSEVQPVTSRNHSQRFLATIVATTLETEEKSRFGPVLCVYDRGRAAEIVTANFRERSFFFPRTPRVNKVLRGPEPGEVSQCTTHPALEYEPRRLLPLPQRAERDIVRVA